MRAWHTIIAVGLIAACTAVAVPSYGQQVTVGTPFRTNQDHFFENSNISWAGNLGAIPATGGAVVPYLNFSYGGGALATPPFGSPQMGAGLSANFAILGKNGQVFFGTNFGQGYTQSSTSQVPSVTVMNGQTGYVSDTSLTPFVISVVPVVGAFPVGPQQLQAASGIDPNAPDPRIQALLQAHADAQQQAAAQAAAEAKLGGVIPPLPKQFRPDRPAQPDLKAPNKAAADKAAPQKVSAQPAQVPDAADRLSSAQESSAGRPAVSVTEAKRLHEQELARGNGEMAALMERARALEEDGKPNVAKIYYQRVAKHATGELQQQARQRLYELQGSK
jgi:hypothetical protein